MCNTYVSIYRNIMDFEYYTDVNTCHLFMHLILLANHKPKKFLGHVINTGQLVITHKSLKEKTGLTEQNIRTALKKLSRNGYITLNWAGKFTILTIEKYDEFALLKSPLTIDQQTTNNPLTVDQQATNSSLTTTNKDIKNNKKNISLKRYIKKENQATPIDPNLTLSDEWLNFAKKERNIKTQYVEQWFNDFKTYWLERSHTVKGKKVDWFATWRNWVQRAFTAPYMHNELELGLDVPEDKRSPQEALLDRLGHINWKRDKKQFLLDKELSELLEYEKSNGDVWWYNSKQFLEKELD